MPGYNCFLRKEFRLFMVDKYSWDSIIRIMSKLSALFFSLIKTSLSLIGFLIISGSFWAYSSDKNETYDRKALIGSYLDNLSSQAKSIKPGLSPRVISRDKVSENRKQLSFSPAMARRIEKEYRDLLIINSDLAKENNSLKDKFSFLEGANRDYSLRIEALKSNLTELRLRLNAIEESLDNL